MNEVRFEIQTDPNENFERTELMEVDSKEML